ncbi:MAG: energy-coupling factor transporter transmembrane component T [Chloroflexota bacterium]
MIDPRAWLIWLTAIAAIVLTTRNPLYLTVLLAVVLAIRANFPPGPFQLPLGRFALVIFPFSMIFNALSIHVGETVLFRLPPSPLIGGIITLEAAVFGLINGLLLLTLLALFLTFNQVVAAGDLIRLTPRALYDLGLVALIAITYVPETMQQLQRIREAQAIRGHRLRGWRDWRPVAIPLLVGGLERAMNLAEAMVARGYGATTDERQPLWVRFGLAIGLAAGLGGWLLTFWWAWLGWSLLLLGLAMMGFILWRQGQRVQVTRYRTHRWTSRETVVVITAVFPLLLIFIPWPFLPADLLFYTTYPAITPPPFNPWVGLSLALFAIPALV